MKFDRKAAGEGVEALCRLNRGGTSIEWRFTFLKSEQEDGHNTIRLIMRDKEGQIVLLCIQEAEEEEPLTSFLLQPHLWSCQCPYLYDVEVVLQNQEGKETDRLNKQIPLRELCLHPRRGWLLNGEELTLKSVEYMIPPHTSRTEKQRFVWRDFRLLKEMGVNCIHTDPSLWNLCEKAGFLIWQKDMAASGEELLCLTGEGSDILSSLFYEYKAKWSSDPFVYIVPEGISVLPSGNLKVTVYSNCSRVILYSDGMLFEFQSGEERFVFEEVPAHGPCVMLSAEGDECSMSFSFHKTFEPSGICRFEGGKRL